MSPPHLVLVDDVPWEPHPRFAALQVKVLESKATHAFASIMLVRVDVGGVIPEHSHTIEIETAHVLSGEAVLTVDGQDYPFGAGINASIPISAKHSVRNTGATPLMIYAVHTPPIR